MDVEHHAGARWWRRSEWLVHNHGMPHHWDDLHVLQTIDRRELEVPGNVDNGLEIMERVAGEHVADPRDFALFVHELLLAQRAGYLEFKTRRYPGMNAPDPEGDANIYLQNIYSFNLTLAGRDRARGRVILVDLPGSDEDDGRPIGRLALTDIARIIAHSYDFDSIPSFLEDSGILLDLIVWPEADGSFDPDAEVAWRQLLSMFTGMLRGGAQQRRVLREFIGAWLDNNLHTGPSIEQQTKIATDLARQGWHVRESRLVIGEHLPAGPNSQLAVANEAVLAGLHSGVLAAAASLYHDGHRAAAVEEAYKAIDIRVQHLASHVPGLEGKFGTDLMGKAFGGDSPVLRLNDGASRSDRSEQEGFAMLYKGAMMGIRNLKAHQLHDPLAEERAVDYLAFASLLMRRLDDAESRMA